MIALLCIGIYFVTIGLMLTVDHYTDGFLREIFGIEEGE